MNQDELIEIIDNLPSVSNQKLSETIELMLADNKLFDGDENSLLESQKVVFDESLKRLDSPEVSTSLFFAIYGDNNSNDGFSKIYNDEDDVVSQKFPDLKVGDELDLILKISNPEYQ